MCTCVSRRSEWFGRVNTSNRCLCVRPAILLFCSVTVAVAVVRAQLQCAPPLVPLNTKPVTVASPGRAPPAAQSAPQRLPILCAHQQSAGCLLELLERVRGQVRVLGVPNTCTDRCHTAC